MHTPNKQSKTNQEALIEQKFFQIDSLKPGFHVCAYKDTKLFELLAPEVMRFKEEHANHAFVYTITNSNIYTNFFICGNYTNILQKLMENSEAIKEKIMQFIDNHAINAEYFTKFATKINNQSLNTSNYDNYMFSELVNFLRKFGFVDKQENIHQKLWSTYLCNQAGLSKAVKQEILLEHMCC